MAQGRLWRMCILGSLNEVPAVFLMAILSDSMGEVKYKIVPIFLIKIHLLEINGVLY